jgi:hypothetical protein
LFAFFFSQWTHPSFFQLSLWFRVGGTFQKFGFFFFQFLCHNIEKIRLKTNIRTHAIAKINKSSFSTTVMKTLLLLISLSSNNETMQIKQVS